MKKILLFLGSFSVLGWVYAQTPKATYTNSKFEQLGPLLPTPNVYRTGGGMAGHSYWQQKADYKIKVELDDAKQEIRGSETITYYNNSPNELSFIWLQLDQNRFDKNSDEYKTMDLSMEDRFSFYFFSQYLSGIHSEGGYKLTNLKDKKGKALQYSINKTMMRIDLDEPIKANGGSFTFSLDWSFKIVDAAGNLGSRGGYEYFPDDDNYIYEMAQWFPRMAVYNDVNGWQNKQFLGRGEFALSFGDYEVSITVPSDHIVAATGELQNPKEVLNEWQIARLKKAEHSSVPLMIQTQEEAIRSEQNKATSTKTWIYKAHNVRDFAWASSRKFIWDAMMVKVGENNIWAMSYYPKEGNPLWEEVSTKAVAITLKEYSKYTIDYPYPVAISVHGPVGGMEYPMISFNNQGRPDKNGSYSDNIKFNTVAVIVHEVGHNFFPMIVNSDERQWTWMDEGLNSFCEYRTCLAWDKDFPVTFGPASMITAYMKGDPEKLVPIMTTSDNIHLLQFGNNAYSKPATALNILRETILGHELFDKAFKEYAKRWAFKHPEPADFFRTMEQASGVDLDWFWRGWFYTTEPVDLALTNVKLFLLPDQKDISKNKDYPFEVKKYDTRQYGALMGRLKEDGEHFLSDKKFYYDLNIENKGGLLSPVIIKATYNDSTNEVFRIPAEIWRLNPDKVSKIIITDKEVTEFVIDPHYETADIDISNNSFPKKESASKFDQFKEQQEN